LRGRDRGSIQTELRQRNSLVDDAKRVQIRIGINIGDVIEDCGAVYGDGVEFSLANTEMSSRQALVKPWTAAMLGRNRPSYASAKMNGPYFRLALLGLSGW
jgi:class 3 adenylate cyclase